MAAPVAKKARTTPLIGTHSYSSIQSVKHYIDSCMISGTFHADEALAVNLLKTLETYKNADLVRTRDPKILDECDIVVDVGGVYDDAKKRYDHHQRGFEETFGPEWSTKLSSAGLVFKHYGQEIISTYLKIPKEDPRVPVLYKKLYGDFVEGLDGIDNGISQYEAADPSVGIKQKYRSRTDLSARIGGLNPSWNEPSNDQILDEKFQIASTLAGSEFFLSLTNAFSSWFPARTIVEQAFTARSSNGLSEQVMIFENACPPWKGHLYELEKEHEVPEDKKVLYVLYSDDGGKWRIQAVPVSSESFASRKPLPEPWRGVRDAELSAKTGIEGCIFVHASGFIGGAQTKEGAMEMARKALTFA